MKKASKTHTSQQLMQNMIVNSSLEDWDYLNRHKKTKQSTYSLQQCYFSNDTKKKQEKSKQTKTLANQPTKQSFYSKVQLTPVNKHIIIIPDVSKSVSQHKQGSKLSIQLNQLSVAFNKQNKRMQQALFEIRQSTVKKQKQRYLKSMSISRSKKSHTSKKSSKSKFDKSIIKVLDFENKSVYNMKQLNNFMPQSIKKDARTKSKAKQKDEVQKTMIKGTKVVDINNENILSVQQKNILIKKTGLRKKNLNDLMKQQKVMIKKFNSQIRAI